MKDKDKFLTEAMGKCWHECVDFSNWTDETKPPYCVKCRMDIFTFEKLNPDYSTWQGFGELWSWAIKKKWFYKFSTEISDYDIPVSSCRVIGWNFINPSKFADALHLFLKERG